MTASNSSKATTSESSSSPAKKSAVLSSHRICSIVDTKPELKGVAISYISPEKSVIVRESSSLIQNHAVIVPVGETSTTSGTMRERLIDVGVDCGLALPLSYFASAAACGGATVTLGTTAPLCAFSLVGATTGSLKCGSSIGKLIDHAIDPKLNDSLNQNEAWQQYENAVDWIDLVSNIPDVARNIKNMGKLSKLTSKYGKQVYVRVSKSESKKLYRQLAEELGESFSNQKTRQWVNARGLSSRFTSSGVINYLRSEINCAVRSISIAATNIYNDVASINNRGNISPHLPKADIVKASASGFVDMILNETAAPQDHGIILMQQAKP